MRGLPLVPQTAGEGRAAGAAPDAGAGPGPTHARLARSPLEDAADDDALHDYVLSRYEPLSPQAGKLRSINVLIESFAWAGVEAEGVAIVRLLREGLGPFRTVWGIKRDHASAALSWELYFYDFARARADLSIPRLRELLSPAIEVDAAEPWVLPWHMVSIELDAARLRARGKTPAHVYIDMRSYELAGSRFTFENVYTFHDPRRDVDAILHRLRSSVHFDPERDSLATLMPPSLRRCERMCVANKRRTDALYFSRVRTPALAEFLAAEQWPEALRALVDAHAGRLDHLLWDVGVDFDRADGALRARKTGVYGSF